MNIKDFLIKKLGGYTEKEYNHKHCMAVEVDTKNYYIDEDTLEVEKEQLAYKLGKELLENNLIKFKVIEGYDSLYTRIYNICAQIFVSN